MPPKVHGSTSLLLACQNLLCFMENMFQQHHVSLFSSCISILEEKIFYNRDIFNILPKT